MERGPHPTKRLEQLTAGLSGARFFSTPDADEGFWQLGRTETSSKLCTFIIPWGRFRFVRLLFGLINAGDEFQRLTDNMLARTDGLLRGLGINRGAEPRAPV